MSDGAPLIGTQVKKGSFLGVSVEGDGEKLMTVPNGTLAGSLIPLDEQVHRLMLATDCPFEGAVRAASEVPASFVNCSGRKGRIAVGFDADCVLWKQIDGQMQVVATFCRGELAFCRDEFWSRVDTLD